MPRPTALALAFAALAQLPEGPRAPTFAPPAQELLDQYERGKHQEVLDAFAAITNIGELKKEIERSGSAWAQTAGPTEARRRRLVAASFAVELAHARVADEWTGLRSLVEWACKLLGQDPPSSGELAWQLAALAVTQRARDHRLLFLDKHLSHAERRFPAEPAFQLARALELEIHVPPEKRSREEPTLARGTENPRAPVHAEETFRRLERLLGVPDVAAEAALHLGYLHFRMGRLAPARAAYERALQLSNDPFVRYLALYFAGRSFEYERRGADAELLYRRALEVLPDTQSGAMSRSAMLLLLDRPSEAYAVIDASFAAKLRPADPWRLFGYRSFRHWPVLVHRLRAETRR